MKFETLKDLENRKILNIKCYKGQKDNVSMLWLGYNQALKDVQELMESWRSDLDNAPNVPLLFDFIDRVANISIKKTTKPNIFENKEDE
jgi:hypothetical protein